MNRRSGSGSGIFLMEMMVVVFFFMLCASTCILAFAKSDRMSRLAWERDHAVSAAQSETELWKLSDERMDGKQDRYWNADWEETQDPAAAVYTGVRAGYRHAKASDCDPGSRRTRRRTVCAGSSEICETIARRTPNGKNKEPGRTAGGGSQETSGG